MRVDGLKITHQIEGAHASMFARWCRLFPLIRFVDEEPGNMNKYV
jgi:hypothetical protein